MHASEDSPRQILREGESVPHCDCFLNRPYVKFIEIAETRMVTCGKEPLKNIAHMEAHFGIFD